MKLISCYIEAFGNIKQTSLKFNGSLTSYCERNGYGKTTLAAFLKAMFYGLKQTTARDKELGERARFYPFDGGKFGGNVTFERDGVEYRIERFFGKKSATEDSLTVYADGEIMAAEDLGKEFFGLDEQSFLRTVFINSSDTESGATGDISRMLNGFVDDDDFELAKKILERQQREFKAGKGRGGKIDAKHEEVLRLKESIENKEKINSELALKYEERKTLAGTVASLEARQHSSRDKNLVLQKWTTYDSILADAETEKEKLAKITDKYPSGLPEADEAKELKKQAEYLSLATERQATVKFSEEKSRKLDELSLRFRDGVPTEEDIAEANGMAAEVIRLDAEIAGLENLTKISTENKFAMRVPEEGEVKRCAEKIATLREKKASGSGGPVGKTVAIVFAALAVLCIMAGIALMFLDVLKTTYCGILIGVGGAMLFVAVFAYFRNQIKGISASTRVITELENDARSFLARYGYYSDGGVEVDYNNLVRDLEIYNSAREDREKNEKLLSEKKVERDEKKSQVKSFLGKYSFWGESAQSDLNRLSSLAAEYVALNHEKEEFETHLGESGADIEKHTRTVDEILSKYSIEKSAEFSAQAGEIESDRTEADRLSGNIEKLEKRAEDYLAEHGLEERPEDGEEDTLSIDGELYKKRDELSLLDREISDDEGAVERLSELKEELESAVEEEAALKKKYSLLEKTIALLEKAEQNLKDRYVSPVKNSFVYYSQLLEEVLGEKVSFDKDFKVRFERGGENRSDAHLSAGQKSLCALCLRLALIDNMYKGDKPFVIMDDPFVHLDGEHLVRAKELLKGLAADRQIIYFCCHESRKI